jgi:hypothetical protein
MDKTMQCDEPPMAACRPPRRYAEKRPELQTTYLGQELYYTSGLPSSSGSFAKTAAIRCASSRVSSSRRRTGEAPFRNTCRLGLPRGVLHHKTAIQFLD